VYVTPSLREFPLEFVAAAALKKNEGRARTRWWKEFDDMCITLDTIPECDGRTDGQKDRMICHKSIALCMHKQCRRAIKTEQKRTGVK